MTRLLHEAFEKASGLPGDLQDEIARQWLEELEWEVRWDATLAGSQQLLETLALQAVREYRNCRAPGSKRQKLDAIQ